MKRLFYLVSTIAFLMLLTACSLKQKAETERLVCAEAEVSAFPYHADGLKVTRHQTVTPVEGVKGLEVIETSFVNEGKPVTVKAYELCRTETDPESSAQVRMKRKAYAAMAPGLAYYGDHVEMTDGGDDFASQIGTGSVIGSKFTWPEDNTDVEDGPFVLTEEKEALIRKWMKIYKGNDLARGEL